jgi:hypothetical protein
MKLINDFMSSLLNIVFIEDMRNHLSFIIVSIKIKLFLQKVEIKLHLINKCYKN